MNAHVSRPTSFLLRNVVIPATRGELRVFTYIVTPLRRYYQRDHHLPFTLRPIRSTKLHVRYLAFD